MKEIIKLQYKRFYNQEHHGYCNVDEVDSNNLTYTYNGKEKVKSIFNQKNFDTKEETFVKEFGNPLYSVNKEYFMVVLEKREDKVSLKYFIGSKSRGVGKSWFKTSKNVYFLTVNTKTGDVYHGNMIGYQRKKCVKKITRNYFFP